MNDQWSAHNQPVDKSDDDDPWNGFPIEEIRIPPFIAVLFWGTVLFMIGLASFLGWVLMRFIDRL